jgi:hypothetical protein
MAKRTPRRSQPAPPPVTPKDRVQALLRKFRAIAEDHVASGGSAAEWVEALQYLGEQGVAGESNDSEHFRTLETFAQLLELWYSDANWLDGGQPRPLKPRARSGFPALCRALGVADEPASLVSLGLAVGVLIRTDEGSLLPVDRTAIVSRPSAMLLDMLSIGMAAWQGTIRHNTKASTTDETRRLDRGTYGSLIPAAVEDEYHRMSRQAGKQFIDSIDNWLQAHRPRPSDRDLRKVAAHVFAASQDDPKAPVVKRKGTRRAKR